MNGSAEAHPGYFAIKLNNSIHAEMTATKHTTLYRFNLPQESQVRSQGGMVPVKPLVLIDLTDLMGSRSGGSIAVDPESGRITGNGTFSPSFGRGSYTAHFCADFRGAAIRQTGTFVDVFANETAKEIGDGNGVPILSGSVGAWIHFDRPIKNRILARVGVSFISVEQACRNADQEVPFFEFDKTVAAAGNIWAEKMSAVGVDNSGLDDDLLKTFWSGLYRTFLSPQDYTGENQLWDSNEPYFDSFYCIWDSFRAQHPLLSIVDPEEQIRMVRSLLDIYEHEGYLPDCRMSFSQGYTQGGSNADVVVADAFVKNLTNEIDWNLAYQAVVKDAEVEPLDWTSVGRGNVEGWKKYGYVATDDFELSTGKGPMTRSVSRTVEYAYNDFAIALMAKGLGKTADEEKYIGRSRNWRNLYNPHQADRYTEKGGLTIESPFTGFLQPRSVNGTFKYQNPRLCSPMYEQHVCYFDTIYDTYEGSPWLYTFFVPQDMASLIDTLGGKDTFIRRLDFFHSSKIIYMGNEQSFLPTFQFHYGGRPGLSSYWVHQYVPGQFNSSINGIPGNDDCAMGAFSTFAFLGFFPVAGQNVYLLTPPMFREIRLRTPTGRSAIIRNIGFDSTYEAIYIQSAKLNGQQYTKNWITHDFFYNGGLLELTLGTSESTWGTADEDLPPSMSTNYGSF